LLLYGIAALLTALDKREANILIMEIWV